jgi:hypothetical protein
MHGIWPQIRAPSLLGSMLALGSLCCATGHIAHMYASARSTVTPGPNAKPPPRATRTPSAASKLAYGSPAAATARLAPRCR